MNKKIKNILSAITNIFFAIVFVSVITSTIYFINVINDTPTLNVETITKKKSSKIYDKNNNFVKQLTMEDYENIKYEDLPDVFINALLSSEDIRYFSHQGIDLPRILSALKNDILSFSLKEGASTITQQLIKNMMLTNTKSIERKIQEVYLSYNIEKLYTKKDIIEFYCNYVSFDGTSHGVLSASYKFFNKHIKNVTLPEAALLAGVVNAPSAYSPIYHPDAANKRKNMVLNLMHKHGFIANDELESAIKINVSDLLYKNIKEKNDDVTYQYQAYIDIVYKQIYEKTGYDPYLIPMDIYTYIDTVLQKEIDEMQQNKHKDFKFSDDLQQFAATIIDNQNGAIIACFGKRNYTGQKLLNYSYDKLMQPASTIKIPLNYALAFQHLNYNSKEVLLDLPIYYPSTNIKINNVDKTYMGELLISDAIGYSRNTTAIEVLEKVIDKIGVSNVVKYLKSINLMDDGEFSYSYGLGGYTYGVSVTNLAAAYSMIARNGLYIEPLAVKKIKLLDGSNKEIVFTPNSKKVLDDSTCYLLIDVLKQVMDKNIWSINDCKPNGVNIYAKTGTSSFDKKTIEENNYPNNASKDRWLASFSKDYSIAAWSGFDKHLKDKHTYFISNTYESNMVKTFSKIIYNKIALKNQTFTKPDDLIEVKVVKGTNYLSNNTINPSFTTKALYKKDYVPKEYFYEKQISDYVNYDYFILNNEINFVINQNQNIDPYNKIYDENKIFGDKIVFIDIYHNGSYINTIQSDEKIITIALTNGYYNFDIYYKYKYGLLDGVKQNLFIFNSASPF